MAEANGESWSHHPPLPHTPPPQHSTTQTEAGGVQVLYLDRLSSKIWSSHDLMSDTGLSGYISNSLIVSLLLSEYAADGSRDLQQSVSSFKE